MTAKSKSAPPCFEIDLALKAKTWEQDIPDFETLIFDTVEPSILAGLEGKNVPAPEAIEISVVLADDSFVRDLNKRYRGRDKPTNVLSFPQTEEDEITLSPASFLSPLLALGDIILAYETVRKESQVQNKPIEDHLRHLIVHGCLHLLHYDHIEEQDARQMEALEITILDAMGIKNPYERDLE